MQRGTSQTFWVTTLTAANTCSVEPRRHSGLIHRRLQTHAAWNLVDGPFWATTITAANTCNVESLTELSGLLHSRLQTHATWNLADILGYYTRAYKHMQRGTSQTFWVTTLTAANTCSVEPRRRAFLGYYTEAKARIPVGGELAYPHTLSIALFSYGL
jgi:hypothetical protein